MIGTMLLLIEGTTDIAIGIALPVVSLPLTQRRPARIKGIKHKEVEVPVVDSLATSLPLFAIPCIMYC